MKEKEQETPNQLQDEVKDFEKIMKEEKEIVTEEGKDLASTRRILYRLLTEEVVTANTKLIDVLTIIEKRASDIDGTNPLT